MSNHSPLSNDSIAPSETERTHDEHGRPLLRSVKQPAQFLSFWIAIALPFVYLPLLAQGLDSVTVTLTFLALLVINVLALYAGHGHKQER